MNKIAVVMMVKNEMDIIESCVRHAATFADEILICDHMSTDQTPEILQLLKDEGLPIEISYYTDNAYAQAKVTTKLINDAINRGKKIIVPLDADEFLIMPNGKNSQDLRYFLQNLDPDQIYEIHWTHCALVEPEQNQNQFILNRPTLKSVGINKFTSKEKSIVGSDIWQRLDLTITQGNHCALLPNGQEYKNSIRLNEIENWHYRCRSRAQWLSKDLTQFITLLMSNPKNDILNSALQMSVTRFLSNQEITDEEFNRMTNLYNPDSADEDLAPYRDECTLKFSKNNTVNPLQNVFLLACFIAQEFRREKITRNRKQSVRVFIFHLGNSKKTLDSLESVMNQNYPLLKVFIVLLKDYEFEKLIEGAANFLDQLHFVTKEQFSEVLTNPDGKYVQFVIAGDLLDNEKIMRSVEFLNGHSSKISKSQRVAVFTGSERDKIQSPQFYECQFLKISGKGFFKEIVSNGKIFNITSTLFEQKLFTDKALIDNWIDDAQIIPRQFVLWSLMPKLPLICYLKEKLVEVHEDNWTYNDLEIFNQVKDFYFKSYQ